MKNIQLKEILIIHDGQSEVTVSTYFRWLLSDNRINVAFKVYSEANAIDYLHADIVIFVRYPGDEKILQFLKALNTETYYFTDDNFLMLDDLAENDSIVRYIKEHTNVLFMSQFTGILVSTRALKKFFITNGLNTRCELFPDIWCNKALRHPRKQGSLRIAFFGGSFRQKSLIDLVLPALHRLNTDIGIQIELYSPDLSRWGVVSEAGISLKPMPYFEYEAGIDAYSRHEIDILVHPGVIHENNKYKSLISLLNAQRMGAVLIASKNEPYLSIPQAEDFMFLAQSSVDDWYDCLHSCLDINQCDRMVQNAQVYIDAHYDGEINKAFLNAALDRCIDKPFNYVMRVLNEQMHIEMDKRIQAAECEAIKRAQIAFDDKIISLEEQVTTLRSSVLKLEHRTQAQIDALESHLNLDFASQETITALEYRTQARIDALENHLNLDFASQETITALQQHVTLDTQEIQNQIFALKKNLERATTQWTEHLEHQLTEEAQVRYQQDLDMHYALSRQIELVTTQLAGLMRSTRIRPAFPLYQCHEDLLPDLVPQHRQFIDGILLSDSFQHHNVKLLFSEMLSPAQVRTYTVNGYGQRLTFFLIGLAGSQYEIRAVDQTGELYRGVHTMEMEGVQQISLTREAMGSLELQLKASASTDIIRCAEVGIQHGICLSHQLAAYFLDNMEG